MLDHVTIGISDIERSKAFYDAALRSLEKRRLLPKCHMLQRNQKGRQFP